MAQALLDAVRLNARGRIVTAVRAQIGARFQVDCRALAEAFAEAASGTLVEGALLDLTIVPITWTCRSCGWTSMTEAVWTACAVCGGQLDASGGDGLVLTGIDVPWWEVR
jgi:hydrogenase nickel incorporation protein HypA/HybF